MIEITPITFKEAKEFVNEHHRHNVAPQGQKFSIGVKEDGALIGVVTVGRPIARRNDDGKTAEITRCCVIEGHKNANSLLYAAAWRAARAMGYRRIITVRIWRQFTGRRIQTSRNDRRQVERVVCSEPAA